MFSLLRNLSFVLVIASSVFGQKQLLDRIVAVVDDEVILSSELQQYSYMEAVNRKINPQTDEAAFRGLERQVLEALINQKIMLAQAKHDSIQIDDSQVENALDQQIQERIQQAGGEKELEKYLGKTVKELRRIYKGTIKKQMLAQRIQATKFNDIKVSRSEIESFFESNRDSFPEVGESVNLSQILMEVKAGEEAFAGAKQTATQLLDSIKRGADFGQLARVFSNDPGSARRGGELGWYHRGDFVKEFSDAAVRLEPGELSDVVRTQFGYHIIQLIAKNVDKINVRHILIAVGTTEADKALTKTKLGEIRQDIVDGKMSFEEAAIQYSDDPAKKGNLGNLGWIEVATFQDKAFLSVSKSLEVGAISQPFETQFGFHIIRLNDRRDKRRVNLKEDWQTIESIALRHKQEREMDKWLSETRKKYFVDIRL